MTGARRRAVLIALASLGGVLLLVVVVTSWPHPNDEAAYWRAGERLVAGLPLYDARAAPDTPYAYWYPPALAEVLAPATTIVPEVVFRIGWSVLLLACLLFLAGGDPLLALAIVAFVPVAVELRVRNVHLVLAALVVLAIRVSPWLWIVAAAIKGSPAIGLVYLVGQGRWRDALRIALVGAVALTVLYLASPTAWTDFVGVVLVRGPTNGGALIPVPFLLRFAIGAALAWIAGRTPGTKGEVLLVGAITIANPTLWMTAFSLLAAIVPLVRSPVRVPDVPRREFAPSR